MIGILRDTCAMGATLLVLVTYLVRNHQPGVLTEHVVWPSLATHLLCLHSPHDTSPSPSYGRVCLPG